MEHVGRDFGQRLQYKSALVHGGMRHFQLRSLDDGIAVQQDVNIDETRPFGLGSAAAHPLFNGKDLRKQDAGRQLRYHLNGAVQEPRLGGEFDRLGFEERRNRSYLTELS